MWRSGGGGGGGCGGAVGGWRVDVHDQLDYGNIDVYLIHLGLWSPMKPCMMMRIAVVMTMSDYNLYNIYDLMLDCSYN